MSDAFTRFRKPSPEEVRLLRALVRRAKLAYTDEAWIQRVLVRTMDDGGMGSFEIREMSQSGERSFGGVAAELQFRDSDGTLVLVALNVDQDRTPFEVDIWRTDFEPVRRIPDELED